ncbi:ribonuclease Oy-like isoform X2 [Acropora millepora]|uniref:ribonuclease Oy-like isoform X2 n=1 Tax=Acropora millepora TaxID=45264 RepID=UPI001CF5C4FC|nr:ribonuclease Oy-like isoform X2 [Acropora millepora]XP_044163168.1 ribonuclease Oy-like isoform X2 [Acropora millepora]XP_044163169.1 ribonuclease Oy-like isoform X2 [Acropora millepora]
MRQFKSEYGAYFDHFVFTQWWPQTQVTCRDNHWTFTKPLLNKTCVPEGITSWTIHGLWPTVGVEHKPVWCNSSWPFDESIIEDLRPKLEKQWPSFEKSHNDIEFWGHEWDKHGTCSTNLAYLNTEQEYFNLALKLNHKLNVSNALELHGITPSNKWTYKVNHIVNALHEYFQVLPTVSCCDKDSGKMLSSVELCLNKTLPLALMDCPRKTLNHDCEYNESVWYPPIVPCRRR